MKNFSSVTETQNTTHKKLQDFLLWFIDLEEIPLYLKKAFVEHLLQVKCFDHAAQEMVAIIMDHLIAASTEKAEYARRNLKRLEEALEREHNGKTSLAGEIQTHAENKMSVLADQFVSGLSEYKKDEIKSANASHVGHVLQ